MTFTLTSFNAHGGLGPRMTGGSEPYDLAGALERIAGDVTIVQETWWPEGSCSAVQAAAARLGAQVFELPFGRAVIDPWPHVKRDGSGNGAVGLSIMTRVAARHVRDLPLGTIGFDHTPQRGGIHLEVDTPGGTVDLIGVHLTSRLPHGPPTQLRRLRAQLPEPTRPAIVSGDCNFWGPGVVACLPGWRRAVRGRTWPASMPHSQIDHVLLRDGGGARLRVVDSRVLPDAGSDHLPVRATAEAL